MGYPRIILIVLVGCAGLACNGAAQIQKNMSEQEVRRILGKPTVVETEQKYMDGYFFSADREECVSRATKVLFYEHWWRKDVSISLDGQGRVLCLREAYNDVQVRNR